MTKHLEIINLSFLLEHERETILGVLKRDEYLKKVEDKRIRKAKKGMALLLGGIEDLVTKRLEKANVLNVFLASVLTGLTGLREFQLLRTLQKSRARKLKNELLEVRRKGGNRHAEQDNSRVCVRCQKSLGFIFDRGDLCQSCKLRVCSTCRVVGADGQWKCSVCAKIAELRIVTGEWFFEERAKRFKQSNLGTDVVRQSILHKFPDAVPNADDERTFKDQPQENEEKKPDVPVCSTNGHKSVFSRPRKIGRVIRAVTKGEITFGKDEGERNRGSEAESSSLRGGKSAPCSESVSGRLQRNMQEQRITDRSRSEIDLSESFSEGNEDTLSVRSKSVPSALDQELGYLDEKEEDIDDIVASCYPGKHEHMTSGLSTTQWRVQLFTPRQARAPVACGHWADYTHSA
ncbi:hypothetical protein DUI87_15706 [Hirundo rustica rustica]|uniref:RabBD domain-containing protein n=1 Tax=Hirundo rustica rustica TaxID=333673 RepID=A0A3M0JZI8_HIRRU|nr:hypothetical protein DUI87_15706 [Hirundo rustica rustica]